MATVTHDPSVCGLDEPGYPSLCPGCRVEQSRHREMTADDAAWQLMLDLGLPRRPQTLPAKERRAILLRQADLALTCRRDPVFAGHLRALLREIMGGDDR